MIIAAGLIVKRNQNTSPHCCNVGRRIWWLFLSEGKVVVCGWTVCLLLSFAEVSDFARESACLLACFSPALSSSALRPRFVASFTASLG